MGARPTLVRMDQSIKDYIQARKAVALGRGGGGRGRGVRGVGGGGEIPGLRECEGGVRE